MVDPKIQILKQIQQGQLGVQQGIERLLQLKAQQQSRPASPLYLLPEWIPGPQVTDLAPSLPGSVLLFAHTREQRQRLLAQAGHHTWIEVHPGGTFREITPDRYELDPTSGEDYVHLFNHLRAKGQAPAVVIHAWSCGIPWTLDQSDAMLQSGLDLGLTSLFYLTQTLLQSHSRIPPLIGLCDPATAWLGGMLASFARVAQAEDPRFRFAMITLADGLTALDQILQVGLSSQEPVSEWRIDSQGIWQRQLKEVAISTSSFRWGHGPYLISGGMGGLGRILARFLGQQQRTRLALVGRSPWTAVDQSFLNELRAMGSDVEYFTADITELQPLEEVVTTIRARWGELKGVFHTAGVVADQLLRHQHWQLFQRVLAPKVKGTVILDQATRREPLDFFLSFSSIASWFPQPGQANYAAANRFLDEFAQLRRAKVLLGERSGQSLAINWPQWQGGTMVMPAAYQDHLREHFGMLPMPDEVGMQILSQGLSSAQPQITVLYGDGLKMRNHLQAEKPSLNPMGQNSTLPGREALVEFLLDLVAQTVKISRDRINPAADLDQVGLDSILVNAITLKLEAHFGPLPKVLLYEYQSIQALATYFLQQHSEKVSLLNPQRQEGFPPIDQKNPSIFVGGRRSDQEENAIAIIGVQGRYPQAQTLHQFWENLAAGRDCITEVPPERWDYRSFFHPDRQHKGSSYGKWGGFLEHVDHFDPLFFNISPREAETMDPQERLFLEVAWSALEDAGYARSSLEADQERVGVFVGVSFGQYQLFGAEAWAEGRFLPAYSSFWSIPNRVSYILNLKGPSLAVDTACSSSLTAIQLACESLRRQDCSMAIVGGVVLNLHPSKYMALSDMQFLSSDGRCHSFGAGGDGYVPGEGVGAVILKPLSAALAQGDHIYALIKGGSINHGGKTNGYTVPNPRAQAEVIQEALHQAGVEPQSITYVEAHGTGTALGDPIELEGLSKVFPPAPDQRPYCALGSLKSNIGHLEPAAGIAALTKVILQLQYRQLVPTLHAEQVNPNLDLDCSPFYLCRQLQTWTAGSFPRRAAISSFGAGGANAHVIVEAWDPPSVSEINPAAFPSEEVIVLSARDRERLQVYAQQLKDFLHHTPVALPDLAYTLQVGREAFEQRLAVVVRSLPDLLAKLEAFLQGKTTLPHLYLTGAEIQVDPPDETTCFQWFEQRQWSLLLQHWVQGGTLNWATFYPAGQRRRIALPTYPFRPQRISLPTAIPWRTSVPSAPLHPLLDRLCPSLRDAIFTKVLNIKEPWIADHQLQGMGVLPGVAHLEMVRAASELTTGQQVVGFSNIVWLTPLQIADQEQPIQLRLQEGETGGIQFQISQDQRENAPISSRGQVHLAAQPLSPPPPLNWQEIRKRCQYTRDRTQIYAHFQSRGLSYGPLFQRLEQVDFNSGEALATIRPLRGEDLSLWRLHPALLDGALHCLCAFLPEQEDVPQTWVPFSVEQIDLYGSLDHLHFAYARRLQEDAGTARFQISLLDQQGQVLVQFQDLYTRKWTGSASPTPPSVQTDPEIHPHLFYRPVWREIFPTVASAQVLPQGEVLICSHSADLGLGAAFAQAWKETPVKVVDLEQDLQIADYEKILTSLPHLSLIIFLGGVQSCFYSCTDLEFFDQLQEISTIALFRLLKALSLTGKDAVHLKVITNDTQAVISKDRPYNLFAGALEGLARTAAHEMQRLTVTWIDVSKADVQARQSLTDPRWMTQWLQLPQPATGLGLALRGQRCWMRSLEWIEPGEPEILPLRTQGIYLLVGGAGGLGLEISRDLALHHHAHLIWVGRRSLSSAQEVQIQELEHLGATVTYLQADVADVAAMKGVIQQIRRQWGRLDGVFHTAMILEDRAIYAMEETTLRRVLAPKVRGTVVLNQVLEAEALDLMVFCSSAIAFTAAPGQSNYVAGCTFQDTFAQFLHTRKHRPVRIVNWGYWGETGVVASEAYRQRLAQLGVAPLSTVEGIRSLKQVLGSSTTQVMVARLARRYLEQMGVDFSAKRICLPSDASSVFQEALHAAQQAQEQGVRDQEREGSRGLERLESLGRQSLILAWQRMGLHLQPGGRYSLTGLQETLGISPAHHRWFQAALQTLHKGDLIEVQGDEVSIRHWPNPSEIQEKITALAEDLVRDYPDAAASVELIRHCTAHYPQVLTGRQRAVEVLFPQGRTDWVDAIYTHNRRADYFNQILSQGIAAAVAARLTTGQDRVRILEIGAGTGGTTRQVLTDLRPFRDQVDYTFTDLSLKLVQQGELRFRQAYPFTRYQGLDIEQDPASQEVPVGHFDLVLATNVLHATRQIRQTLEHTKSLLKAQGLLVINELTQVTTFATLTFGLTDGWWLFGDAPLRLPHSPLLSAQSWKQILEECGFSPVQWLGSPGEKEPGQVVIWAESDGWIRRPQESSNPSPPIKEISAPIPSSPPQTGQLVVSAQFLAPMVAAILKMDPADLELDVPFERYGVDSLVAMDIINRLEDDFGSLRKDLLFTHSTLNSLADYLSQRSPAPPPPAPVLPQPVASAVPAPPLNDEAIAVIGMSGRFPGADSPYAFWENLQAGRCAIREVPPDRWDLSHYYDASGQTPGTSYSRWGGFLEGVDEFDPLFFQIAPREASKIDPQERLFLEVAWSALEDAGYTRAALNRYAEPHGVGVFVGVMYSTYQLLAAEQWSQGHRVQAHSAYWSIANRVSHVLDLKGPSLAVDTACSSSLTALHLACESIRRGECRAALAGGVNLILHPSHSVALSQLQMLSHGSQPRCFSQEADGLIPGEGVGAVLLKPLGDALRDRDHIYGLIRASCLNSDSRAQGYTVPDQTAQIRLLTAALLRAGISPESISYIEAQAVGSPLADQVEIAALQQVFGPRLQPLRVGSLKPNIGHLEAASGMAQLFKVLLQFQEGMLLPTLISGPLHPDLATSTLLQVQQTLSPWPQVLGDNDQPQPRRAGISSFGAGGANGHVILEEYLHRGGSTLAPASDQLVVLSARKPEQLQEYAQRLLDHLLRINPLSADALADLAYTLQVGREAHPYRLALWTGSSTDLIQSLRAYLQQLPPGNWVTGKIQKQPQDLPWSQEERPSLPHLAHAWVQGCAVNWDLLHPPGCRQRMPLPTYPFAREPYWLAGPPEDVAPAELNEGWIEPAIEPPPLTVPPDTQTEALLMATPVPPPSTASPPLQSLLLEMMAMILALPSADIDPEDSLGDYGFDSISLSEFARLISERWNLEFSPTLFFQYSTLQQLADYLQATYPDPLEKFSPAVDPPRPPDPVPPQPIPISAVPSTAPPQGQRPIAVIGMSGIFPQSPTLRAFWDHLLAQDDMICEIPGARFDWRAIYGDAQRDPGKTNSKWGGFIEGVDHFDAAFFNISPREARLMDPQQRLVLQTVWQAIEDAGYAPSHLSGSRTGLFMGVASHEYAHLVERSGVEIDGQVATGNTHSVLVNRVSYLLNLRGPSEPVDTACSSSLVAVHRALRSLHTGESDLAIAGGINLLLTPAGFLAFGKSGMLAADGRCKTFDDRADGYVRGEGVGVILLKPLDQAQGDGDHIYGVIRGSAVNHGGKAQSLTAPNSAAQAEVIQTALQQAGIPPDTLSYIEVHGTGTALGDPVEVNGLQQVIPSSAPGCGLGTVKTNIGHLETAAGIAGLIKVLLSLQHKTLPGLVHFSELNRHIQLQDSPFYLVTKTQPWERLQDPRGQIIPRRAGVSSFGFGGVNAHVVVEEWEAPPLPPSSQVPQIFLLAARDENRLRAYVTSMITFLEQQDEPPDLADLAYTLQVGRDPMEWRLAVVAQSCEELRQIWQSYLQGNNGNYWVGQASEHRSLVQILNQDPDHQLYLTQLLQKQQLPRIAALWTSGFQIDWSVLHQRRQRISLPTYPFAEEKHWIAQQNILSSTPVQPEPAISSSANPAVVMVPASPPLPSGPELSPPLAQRNGGHSQPTPPATAPTPQPQEEVRQTIRQILAGFLSLDPADIKDDQELLSYGVDSIAGLRIMQRIQDCYGDDVPMMAIVEQPTLARFSAYIYENYVVNRPASAPPVPQIPTAAAVPERAMPASQNGDLKVQTPSPELPRSPLIPFQPQGDQELLVGVHGETGEVSWLLPLALARGLQQPTYGLEAPCFEQPEQPMDSIECLARLYGDTLIQAWGTREVSLMGQGMGAVLAFAVAQYLVDQAGYPVSRLFLLNPPVPGEGSRGFWQQIQQDPLQPLLLSANQLGSLWGSAQTLTKETLQKSSPEQHLAEVTEFLRQHAAPPLERESLLTWVQQSVRSFSALFPLLLRYTPQPLRGSIADVCLVLSPSNQEHQTTWPAWFADPIRIHAVPYEPGDLLRPQHLQQLYFRLIAPGGRARSAAEKGGTAVRTSRWDPAVVIINKNGPRPPSFWIHTMLGDVSYGLNLSHHLGIDHPLFGLEQFDDKGRIFLLPTLPEMAAAHIGAIKRIQPQGPYQVGGYSFGGVVAYEVAQQLQAAGESVSHLLLIDSFMPGTPVFDSIDTQAVGDGDFSLMALIQIGNSLGNRWKADRYILIDELVAKETDAQIQQVALHLYEHSETQLDYQEIHELVRSTYQTIMTNNDALLNYRPGLLATTTQVVLFHATEGFVGPNNANGVPEVKVKIPDRTNGFQAFVEGEMQIYDIGADHYTICNDEFIKLVAQGIQQVVHHSSGVI